MQRLLPSAQALLVWSFYLFAPLLLTGPVDADPFEAGPFEAGPWGKIHPRLWNEDGEEPHAAWVFFQDKGANRSGRALDELRSTYDPRAIERRMLRRTASGLFDERDLPLDETYVESVIASGAELRIRSRWLNAVSVTADLSSLETIAQYDCVRSIEPVNRLSVPPTTNAPVTSRPERGDFYGASESQLSQINLIALHEAGMTGKGVRIGVLDTGFRTSHAAFTRADHGLNIVAEYDFVNNDDNAGIDPGDPSTQHDHGTLILGTMAAYSPGTLVGGAFDASYILAKVESVEFENHAEEDYFVAGLEFIEANGGDVATSSVVIFNSYTQGQLDGETSVMTRAFNAATDNGLHCFQGAGNDGHDRNPRTSHLLPPADAFDVNTVGAVTPIGTVASFSSDGPTADGRVKPEILAPGEGTYTVDPQNDAGLATASGTSLATPLAAAAAACLIQDHPNWTVFQLREALARSADYFVQHETHDPLFVRGYGLIDAMAAYTVIDPSNVDPANEAVVPSIGKDPGLPMEIRISPSPASTEGVWIHFDLPHPRRAVVSVVGSDGRVVWRCREPMVAGRQSVHWDGLDNSGKPVAAGAYFVRVEDGPRKGSVSFVVLR